MSLPKPKKMQTYNDENNYEIDEMHQVGTDGRRPVRVADLVVITEETLGRIETERRKGTWSV